MASRSGWRQMVQLRSWEERDEAGPSARLGMKFARWNGASCCLVIFITLSGGVLTAAAPQLTLALCERKRGAGLVWTSIKTKTVRKDSYFGWLGLSWAAAARLRVLGCGMGGMGMGGLFNGGSGSRGLEGTDNPLKGRGQRWVAAKGCLSKMGRLGAREAV
jgi:hypothetical protein